MRKLAWFAAGFAAVCLVRCYTSAALPVLAAAGCLTLLCLPLRLSARSRPALFAAARRGLALGLGAVLAWGWFSLWTAAFKSPADALDGQTQELTGTVSSLPRASISGWSVTVELDGGFNAPDVLMYGNHDWGELRPGDHIAFTARLRSSGQRYGADTTYYSAQGLFLLGYDKGALELLFRPAHTPLRFLPALCAGALKDSVSAAFGHEVGPLAAAVATGDKTDLPDELYSALSRSGTAHMAAVSGMHISILVCAALLLTGNRRRTAAAFIPVLLFYAVMTGASPSALRAVVMQSVLLCAPLLKRENDPPTSLGFALLVLLLANPYAAGSVSLQLSFTSVAGILTVTGPLTRRLCRPLESLRRRGRSGKALARLLGGGAAMLAVSLAAMVFSLPLLCCYFRQVSLVFPVTNLLIVPVLPVFFLCVLAVGTLGVFLPGLAAPLGAAAGLLGRYTIAVVSLLGRWRFAAVDAGNLYYALCLAAVYLFLAWGLLLRKHRLRPVIPLCCFAALLAGALGFSRAEVIRSDLTITALDVGQGSCTALLSEDTACLMDCGGSGRNAGDAAANYFASLGTARLDLLVLTHFDNDHINGAAQLFARMDVAAVAVPNADTEDGQRILELAQAEGAAVMCIDRTLEYALGSAALTLYPPLGSGTSNEEGLFALCSAGEFDVLITGDADSFVEKMLVKYYDIPDIELLIAGHHGSAGSTSGELLDALTPELAVISCGYNTYGHPAPETLERLEQRNVDIYRTDEMGSVTIYVRSDGYAAKTQK